MNTTDNPYSILGVSQDADDGTIKKAYRQAAKLHHPDKQTSEEDRKLATHRFAKIADAYALLNDPVRRYDWRQANENTSRASTSQRSSVPKPTSVPKTTSPSSQRQANKNTSRASAPQRSQEPKRNSMSKTSTPSPQVKRSGSFLKLPRHTSASTSPQVKRSSSFQSIPPRHSSRSSFPKLKRNSSFQSIPRHSSHSSASDGSSASASSAYSRPSVYSGSTASSSTTGRRKSRVSATEFTTSPSMQPSKGRRAPTNLPQRETSQKSIPRRTTSAGSDMGRMRTSVNEPAIRPPAKPKRASSNVGRNISPVRSSSMASKKSNAPSNEKGRKKSRAPLGETGATPINKGRRLRRAI
ncbi:unnamed protein product [Cylindrotheca closterium]|uniref:J domain-containing protein n=1 Tax=Cylindrotheca closterium TaxID=2856 RepID=A0AAD2FW71_9STRA|nr:unnamed protein product [Cylindrotheca closterium]